MSLSSLIQTLSIDEVIKPFAQKVDELRKRTQFPIKKDFTTIFQPAKSVLEAVQWLAQTAKAQIATGDEFMQKDMKPAYEQTLLAAQHLIEATIHIQDAVPPVDCRKVYYATHDMLEGAIKILLAWDGGEVRKIVRAAQWTKDRLKLVQAARSMRALVVCYNGFFESMMKLIDVSTQRYQDLIDASKKERIFSCLSTIRKHLPLLSKTMQDFVKNPDTKKEQEKNHHANSIAAAIEGILKAVNITQEEVNDDDYDLYNISESSDPLSDHDESDDDDTMATHLKNVQDQLTGNQTQICPELDVHIRAIIKNSKTVAQESKPHFQVLIFTLCDETLSIRKDLNDHYEAFQEDPESEETKLLFNNTVDNLCSKLRELDKVIDNSVADQVAEAYVKPSIAIEDLMGAVVTSSSLIDDPSSDSIEGLTKTVEVFRRHSRRLSKVAIHAAQGTLSRRRSKRIKKLTKDLDDLTRRVVTVAVEVRKNPQNLETRHRLNELRKEWAEKVKDLTAAIDEIINVEDFTAATEATIVDDMKKCRNAVQMRNWSCLITAVNDIEAKAQRFVDVSKSRTSSILDMQLKIQIQEATNNLDQAVKEMVDASEKVMEATTGNESTNEEMIANSLEQVLVYIHGIQDLLSNIGEPPVSSENSAASIQTTPTVSTAAKKLPQSTSTPQGGAHTGTPPHYPPPPPHPYTFSPTPVGVTPTGRYDRRTLSPSDEWIQMTSFEDTTPSSFAPTNPSVHDEVDYLFHSGSPDGADTSPAYQPITYPSSLGSHLLQTPSYLGGTPSWQQSDTPSFSDSKAKGKKSSLVDSNHLLQSYTQPLQSVLAAAAHRDQKELHSKASVLLRKAQDLTRLAKSAAANAHDQETASILNKESAQLDYLTPRFIRRAEEVLCGGGGGGGGENNAGEDLEALRQQWTGHVQALLEAAQDANMPWSQTARRLVSSAKMRKGLDKEVSHVGSQTKRMISVATTTIKAATIEDAIGSTGNLECAQDPIVQDQIEKVKDHVETIESITPEFISTAHEVAQGKPQEDKLNFLSHEWATNANVLMRGVDDITIGMSGPADSLMIAANSNDPTLLEEQASSIKRIAASMLAISQDAIQGCNNEEQVQSVLETAEMLQQLSIELVEYAQEILSLLPERRGEEQHQLAVESAEVLRRDWAAKMHLLTAHIDDLTAGVAGPLDRLVSVALQASRTDGMAKDHLMEQFEKKEEFVAEQLEEVNLQLVKLVKEVRTDEPSVRKCMRSMGFLREVSPHAIGAARSLATDPSSNKLDHFSHLRRQWAAKAQNFYSTLLSVSEGGTDVTAIVSAFEDLLQGHRTTRSTPSTYKTRMAKRQEEKREADKSTAHRQRYYSTEDLEPPSYPPPLIPADNSYLSYKTGGDSPQHLPAVTKYPWSTTDTSVAENAAMETSLNTSLVVAAKTLHDAAEEFEEEGNPLVSLAKKMSNQMYQMAEFTCGRGKIKSMEEMISTSKDIAEDAKKVTSYAEVIKDHCTDKRIKINLQNCVNTIPNLSSQLRIVAAVKFSTLSETDFSRADKILEKNAQNLMIAVVETIQAAEAAYVKGLKPPTSEDEEHTIIKWKRKQMHRGRHHGGTTNPLNAKGLRRLSRGTHLSLVSQVLHSPYT